MGRRGTESPPAGMWWPLGPAGRAGLVWVTGRSWQGAGEGGDNGPFVFAEISPSKTLQPLDKHDLIPPQGSNMKGRNKPGVGPTPSHFTDWKTKSPKEWKEDKRALRLRSRPEFTPSWVAELREGPQKTAKVQIHGGGQTGCGGVPARPLTAVRPEELSQLLRDSAATSDGGDLEAPSLVQGGTVLDITDQGPGPGTGRLKVKVLPSTQEGGSPHPGRLQWGLGLTGTQVPGPPQRPHPPRPARGPAGGVAGAWHIP